MCHTRPIYSRKRNNGTLLHEERSQRVCSADILSRSHLASTSLLPSTEGALRLGDLRWIFGYAFSGRTSSNRMPLFTFPSLDVVNLVALGMVAGETVATRCVSTLALASSLRQASRPLARITFAQERHAVETALGPDSTLEIRGCIEANANAAFCGRGQLTNDVTPKNDGTRCEYRCWSLRPDISVCRPSVCYSGKRQTRPWLVNYMLCCVPAVSCRNLTGAVSYA